MLLPALLLNNLDIIEITNSSSSLRESLEKYFPLMCHDIDSIHFVNQLPYHGVPIPPNVDTTYQYCLEGNIAKFNNDYIVLQSFSNRFCCVIGVKVTKIYGKTMKLFCLCKTFNNHLNCPGTIRVSDKLNMYNYTLHHMLVNTNGGSTRNYFPKEFKRTKSELNQVHNSVKLSFFHLLSLKQKQMSAVYSGFKDYRGKDLIDYKSKYVSLKNIQFRLFFHQEPEIFADSMKSYVKRQGCYDLNNNLRATTATFYNRVNTVYDKYCNESTKLLSEKIEQECNHLLALREVLVDNYKQWRSRCGSYILKSTAATLPNNFCCIIVRHRSCTQPGLQAHVLTDTYITNVEDVTNVDVLINHPVISTPSPSSSEKSNSNEGIVSERSPLRAADSDLSTIIENISTNHDNVSNNNNNDIQKENDKITEILKKENDKIT